MPFTLSHVAAVLPLLRQRKTWFSATGLIIGSIAPDFEKFLRMGLHNKYSHTWPSLLYFTCPVALGLAFLFHGLVRNPLIGHLPLAWYRRLVRFQSFNWQAYFRRHYAAVLVSILLGGGTHLLWDSFTHRGGELVQLFPLLRHRLHGAGLSVPLFLLISFLSSVLGLGAVGVAVARMPQAPIFRLPAGRPGYWRTVLLTALLLLAVRLALASFRLDGWAVAVTLLSTSMLGVIVASWQYRGSAQRVSEPAPPVA